jgi:hypothetical protein
VINVITANESRQGEIEMTFTIDEDNNVTAHALLPAGTNEAQAFTTARELAKITATWPASRLVETWNSFAAVAPFQDLKSVKKFTNRKHAVARIFEAIARLSPDAAEPPQRLASEKGKAKKAPAKAKRADTAPKGAKGERTNKKAEVVAAMRRPKGITLQEIMDMTGWQQHTVRGFVSILSSKGGLKVESLKDADGGRSYRIAK